MLSQRDWPGAAVLRTQPLPARLFLKMWLMCILAPPSFLISPTLSEKKTPSIATRSPWEQGCGRAAVSAQEQELCRALAERPLGGGSRACGSAGRRCWALPQGHRGLCCVLGAHLTFLLFQNLTDKAVVL